MYNAYGEGANKQANRRGLIQAMVVPDGRGGYMLDLDNPEFQHHEEYFEKESHQRNQNGMPKSVFKAKVICNKHINWNASRKN